MPSPIKSIASDPFSNMVAIGREDGDIEITDSTGKWLTTARIPGRSHFTLKSIVWSMIPTEKGRLFGISLRGFLFEIDLATLSFKNVQESYGGAIWCIAAHYMKPILAVGCEDGTIRIFSYADGNLEYVKALSSAKGSRVLCLAYHPAKEQLFAGFADGTISCLNSESGRSIHIMTGDVMRGANTLIWSLMVLSDSTVITGDNRGHVQFWDGTTGVLMVSFHQHTAEILALAASPDETQVYASGVDCRVTCMRRIKHRSASFVDQIEESEKFQQVVDNQWVYTASHRPHSHDVFALAVCRNVNVLGKQRSKSVDASTSNENVDLKASSQHAILLSGGQDCKLCAYSIEDFVASRPVWVLPIPAKGLVSKSADFSVVAVKHRHHVDLWSVVLDQTDKHIKLSSSKKRKMHAEQVDAQQVETCALALRVELQGAEHIHAFAISPCGRFLALSGHFGFRMWCIIRSSSKHAKQPLTCAKIDTTAFQDTFAQAMCFSTDGARLALCTDKGSILLLNISEDKSRKQQFNVSVWHTFDHSQTLNEKRNVENDDNNGTMKFLKFAVKEVVLSSDGLYLAVSDCAHAVYVYELDRLRLYWKLPASPQIVTCISFLPSEPSNLVVLMTSGLFVYNLNLMTLTPWSEKNGEKISHILNKCSSPLNGIVFDPVVSSRFFIHGQSICVQVDMSQPTPKRASLVTPFLQSANIETALNEDTDNKSVNRPHHKKSKDESSSTNFSMIHAYRSLIDLGCLENQLVSMLIY